MENITDRIYWNTYRNLHNVICFNTNTEIEFKLQRKLEEIFYDTIAIKFRQQLSIELNLLLEKKIEDGEYK